MRVRVRVRVKVRVGVRVRVRVRARGRVRVRVRVRVRIRLRVRVRVRDGGRKDGAQVQVGQWHAHCAHVPSRKEVAVHLVRGERASCGAPD